jgi:ELP3 family radical SAM enzyme/protein acetyltransferase
MCENPDTYKHGGPYVSNYDIEDIYKKMTKPSEENITFVKTFLDKIDEKCFNKKNIDSILIETRRLLKPKLLLSKVEILKTFNTSEWSDEHREKIKKLVPFFIKKANKSMSGILSVTVFTGPTIKNEDGTTKQFSCKYDCHFCPKEPGQARSYLHDEPAVLRANHNNFDPILQFFSRVNSLVLMGHPADKIELLILGGTWDSYEEKYRSDFIRDLFYIANTFSMVRIPKREKLSIEEEKQINITASCKIIGITIETRPDQINDKSIRFYRKHGVTRVQMGTQHTNNTILKKINRGHTIEQTIHAIKMLKNSCFKIDLHLMPNLPGSTPELDKEMFDRIFTDPDLQVHQLKIYPTQIVPWTKIKQWYTEGKYVPYPKEELMDVLIYASSRVPEWIRVNRIIRDISEQYVTDPTANPDMRNDVQIKMTEMGLECRCIRCREILNEIPKDVRLVTRSYESSGGTEYFISLETSSDKIIGFCRLRIHTDYSETGLIVFKDLVDTALVLELHVYGKLKPTEELKGDNKHQHRGFGSQLLSVAEKIAKEHQFKKIAVISGVGVRKFYEKQGYIYNNEESEMMVKNISGYDFYKPIVFIGLLISCTYLLNHFK